MKENWTLTVVGLGGIGGLLSAPLIRQYGDHIQLAARGPRGKHLRANGLTIRSQMFGNYTVQPSVVVDCADELPVQDFVLVCVKNQQLEEAARQIAPIVGPDTVVMTVMNGVTAGKRLRRLLPQGKVLESVIYTVASAGNDYSITQIGNYTHLFVGAHTEDEADAVQQLHDILSGANIDCRMTEDISAAIWSKFVLNCAFNVVTARWGCSIGEVKSSPRRMADSRALMTEARAVGVAHGVNLPDNLVDKMVHRIEVTDDASTSSLSRDFAVGRAGEMEVFCGDVIRLAEEARVAVPTTEEYYQAMLKIVESF